MMVSIPPIRPEVLEEIIREKERGYIGTLINLFLYPRFIALCYQGIEATDDLERQESLKTLITRHETALDTERESFETWCHLLPYLYSLRDPDYGNALNLSAQ